MVWDSLVHKLVEVAVLTGRENYRISNEHCSAYREKQKILILNSKTMLRSPPFINRVVCGMAFIETIQLFYKTES